MIDVEFRIGSRKVSFDKGWDKMEVQVLADVRKTIQQTTMVPRPVLALTPPLPVE